MIGRAGTWTGPVRLSAALIGTGLQVLNIYAAGQE